MSNGRCRKHGGKTPRGLLSPQTTHGRYSKSLPTRLASRYEEAARDTELLTMREDVALLDARLTDVLGRVDTGESGALWQRLVQAKHDYLTAKDKDQDYLLTVLLTTIDEGAADYAAWEDVRSLVDQRTRIATLEQKRTQTLPVNQFMLLAGALVAVFRDSVQRNVADEQERRRTLADASTGVERLISVGDRPRAEAE